MALNTPKKSSKFEPMRIRDIGTVAYRGDKTAVAKRPPREDRRASNGNSGKASAKERANALLAEKHLPVRGPK